MFKELIERLRTYSQNVVAYKLDADFASAVVEAADAIETLTAQLSASEAARTDLARRLTIAQQELAREKEETGV